MKIDHDLDLNIDKKSNSLDLFIINIREKSCYYYNEKWENFFFLPQTHRMSFYGLDMEVYAF